VIRTGLRLPGRALATVTTNVPGPAEQLYILGRPIREILPYVPIAERMRVGVSIFTYQGRAVFGVTTDFASVPEAGAFAADLVDEVNRLAVACPADRPAPPRRVPRTRATVERLAQLS